MKRSTRILKRIPKAARSPSAFALSSAINACLKDNSYSSWVNLLTFSYKTFNLSSAAGKKKSSLSSQIKKNLNNSNCPPINTENNSPDTHQTRSKSTDNNLYKRVLTKISEGDISNAVKIIMSDDSFAPFDGCHLTELQNKHPSPLPEHNEFPKTPTANHLITNEEDVLKAVNSFNIGSAGGLDSLRPSHFHDLLSFSSGTARKSLLSSLTSLCNLMLAGKVNPEIRPTLYGASLIALKKKDGSARPIAIGSFLRRLVAKICCSKIKHLLGGKFRPTQFGFGSPGGCEAVNHSARIYVSHQQQDKVEKVLLKIDFKNAFNMIRRDLMLQSVADNTPELFPFLSQCYKSPSFLMFGNNAIMSTRGVQQGDPLGPALFCLTIDKLIKSIDTEFNCWYLDDGSIGDNYNKVLNNFKLLINESVKVGLEINFSKCELLFLKCIDPDILSKFNAMAPGINVLDRSKWRLLGAPITDEALPSCISEKCRSISLLCSRLHNLPTQVAFYILRNCFATPKLIYILRCSPCWHHQKGLLEIEDTLRKTVESLTNNTLCDLKWTQATLPVSRGGLGIRSAPSLSLPCFLSSFCSAKGSIVSILPDTLQFSNDYTFMEGEKLWISLTKINLPVEKHHIQKAWDVPLIDTVSRRLFESANTQTDRARLNAVSSVNSGDWLNALPVASLGTLLDDFSFKIAVGLRLGCPICVPHLCVCGNQVDELGTHGLSCKFSAGRISRHHAVNDLIKRALISAEIPTVLEPLGTSRDDGKRPDGMTLIPWTAGKPLVWDFTCVDTTAMSHLTSTAARAGAAALSAESMKESKYKNLNNQYTFLPVAVETFGAWGPQGLELIKQIGNKLSELTGDRRSTSFLFQRISIAIQRGNAASIFGTFPTSQALDELLFI